MDFEPINADHAVQSAAFSVILDGPVSQGAVQALGRRRDLTSELPAVQTPEAIELNLPGPSGAPVPRRMLGVQLAHLRPDGTPAWALRLMGQELAVECTRYTRWARVWETARRYLTTGLEVIPPGDRARRIANLAHVVVDQFVANRETYNLLSLLKESRFIAGVAFRAGPTWHNHVGWFEKAADDSHLWLNQLNIDAVRDPNNGQLLVQITHNQDVRFHTAIELAAVDGILDETMNRLHNQNKSILYELLNDEMAQKIGISG
ncbi:uncharacterized protein (TIGR04255 family) [Bradyrhizobium sp. USDA 4449]